jgi:CRP-like cAMP-binding protein
MTKPNSPARDLNDLASFAMSCGAGEFVFREGDAASECFIIQDGQVELSKDLGGRPCRLALLGPGDVFGESALIDDLPRDTAAKTITEAQLLRLDRAVFDQIVREDPAVAARLAWRLASYLRTSRATVAAAPPPEPEPRTGVRAAAKKSTTATASHAAAPRQAVLSVQGTQTVFVLGNKSEAVVGRVDRTTKRSPDIDLTALDTQRSLSRRHATILQKSGRYYLREEPGVTNGTFLNGKRLEAGREVELVDGARVAFGLVKTVFRFRADVQ